MGAKFLKSPIRVILLHLVIFNFIDVRAEETCALNLDGKNLFEVTENNNNVYEISSSVNIDENSDIEFLKAIPVGISSITQIPVGTSKYLKETIVPKNNFQLNLDSKAFKSYKEKQNEEVIQAAYKFVCETENEFIEFRINIVDKNQEKPEFVEKEYTLTVQVPLIYGQLINTDVEISAIDKDLNEKFNTITFNITDSKLNDAFKIETTKDKKKTSLKLFANSALDFPNDLTFTVQAWDDLKIHNMSTANITLKVDRGHSLPKFGEPYYSADQSKSASDNKEGITLVFAGDKKLNLTYGYELKPVFSITPSDLQKYFNITSNGSEVTIRLKDLDKDILNKKRVQVTLKATPENGSAEGVTVLDIILPNGGSSGGGYTDEADSSWPWGTALIILVIILVVCVGGYFLNKRYLKLF